MKISHISMGAAAPVEMTDTTLVAQTIAGDQHSFELLVARYSAQLLVFIGHYLGNNDQARDVLQQVFLQLYLSMSTLHVGKSVRPWLFRVTRNRCLDELRKKRPLLFSELEDPGRGDEDELSPIAMLPDPGPLPQDEAELHDMQRALRQAIQTLPPKLRRVVLLRYAGQLSFAEIGRALAIPETTAKTYFHRSKRLLRVALTAKKPVATAS